MEYLTSQKASLLLQGDFYSKIQLYLLNANAGYLENWDLASRGLHTTLDIVDRISDIDFGFIWYQPIPTIAKDSDREMEIIKFYHLVHLAGPCQVKHYWRRIRYQVSPLKFWKTNC